jgi:hypothetical protein
MRVKARKSLRSILTPFAYKFQTSEGYKHSTRFAKPEKPVFELQVKEKA